MSVPKRYNVVMNTLAFWACAFFLLLGMLVVILASLTGDPTYVKWSIVLVVLACLFWGFALFFRIMWWIDR